MNPNSAERNVRNTYHFYAGDNIGRRSPAALLDMLAEVASQTLHSEKELRTELSNTQTTTKPKTKLESGRKTQGTFFTVQQLLALPSTQLVKQFTAFSSDELKRQYSYTCTLVPDCGQSYTSFASEGKARMSMKAHLAEHLESLRNDKDAYSTFVATTSKYRKTKSSGGNKKLGKSQQSKKLQLETTNKENKVAVKLKNSMTPVTTSKIPVSKEVPVVVWKEETKDEGKSVQERSQKFETRDAGIRVEGKVTHDLNVLDDHCYFEHFQKDGVEEERLSFAPATQDNLESQPTPVTKNQIVLMVVQSDSVQMKEIRTSPEIENHHIEEKVLMDETQIYSQPEIPVWHEDQSVHNSVSEQGMMLSTKPKGKAKFIGTSKEEREMALALMERIKKKGNPTGANLQCRICDPPRSFTALTTLVSHYRSHAGIKPYECRICRSVFTRRHSLKYHMLIHQNQTRFTCADCGKKFRHPSHFREHRRRHTGESPFGCGDCGQRFKTRNTYKRHLKTRHGKVLTTTGELVRISEEECQKVRANRKRKPTKSVVEDENQREEETAVNEINSDGNLTTTPESTIVYYNNNDYDNEMLTVTENDTESQEEVAKTEYVNETEDILVRNNEVNNYNNDFDEKEVICDNTENRLNNNTIGDENIENQQVQIEFLTKEHFQIDNQVIFYDNIRDTANDNFIRLHYKLHSDENEESVDSNDTGDQKIEDNNVSILNESKPISIIRNGKHSGILLLTKNNIPVINRIHSNCSSSNSAFPILAIPQK